MANYEEKELVVEYVNRKRRLEEMKKTLDIAKDQLDETKSKIIEHLEDTGATATAKYEGLGRLTLKAPQLYAGIKEDYKEEAFNFLREQGMEDVIKETVHPGTLSSFIKGMIEEGEPIPAFIKTHYKKNVSFSSK